MPRPRMNIQVALIVAMLSLLIAVTPALAGDLFRRNRPPAEPDAAITVTWFEKGNTIVDASVCREYRDDSRRYPICRKRARELFQNKCREATQANRRSEMPDPQLRAEMKKYCAAAETFIP